MIAAVTPFMPKKQDRVMRAVRAHSQPEFLNQQDEIILFRRLQRAHIAAIESIQLSTFGSCWRIASSARNWIAARWNGWRAKATRAPLARCR